MPRRKRGFLDDGDSDSSAGSDVGSFGAEGDNFDVQAERRLFDDPYQRKKRRKSRRFGDDDESEDDLDAGTSTRKKTDWTRAPAFVTGDTMNLRQSTQNGDSDGDSEDGEEEEGGEEVVEGTDSSEEDIEAGHKSPSPDEPVVRERDEEDERPRFGGIGSRPKPQVTSTAASSDSSLPATSSSTGQLQPPVTQGSLPSAFGAARMQRSFLRESTTPKKVLSREESAHFNKLQSTFGARMLAKMGWETGTGLGVTGDGIVTPVQQKSRPGKIGIAYRGFQEKTEQSKAEARRRGGATVEADEDEEDPDFRRAKKKSEKIVRSDAWKKSSKKLRTKVANKTYDQILAETGPEPPPSVVGKIIDATGARPREVSSLADVSFASWTPSTDTMRLPEIRHNLRLITDVCKKDVEGLARDAKASDERKRHIETEDVQLRKRLNDEAQLIMRLEQVHLVADEIVNQSKELSSAEDASLEAFSPMFSKLIEQFPQEFDSYHLDELVIAAMAPLFRRLIIEWNPLEGSSEFTTALQSWGRALKINVVEEKPATREDDFYGEQAAIRSESQIQKPMTAFESLLWNVWLPKVRSCINNDWSPQNPHPAVRLYETWSIFLPAFIRDNVLDQLILPKVQRAVAEWHPRKDTVPLHTLVFPWLPHVGLRLEEVMADARRKVKNLLRSWNIKEPIPASLAEWKEVFEVAEWDSMLLQYVVPKLGATLRDDFRVNPRKQDMEPIERVLVWSPIIRPSIFSQLLEANFFTKWLDVLHFWLIQPQVNFKEVADWYSFWKDTFPKYVQQLPGVSQGFTRGLQLMDKAYELGLEAPTRLPRPDHVAEVPRIPSGVQQSSRSKARPARSYEITFRSIVEEFAASHNLLLIPTGRAHEKSRMPLFRVSKTVDGKGGLLIYILDDAVWAETDDGEYQAITLEDMIERAASL